MPQKYKLQERQINPPDKLEFSAFTNSRKAETSSHERRLINKSFDTFLFLYFISQRNISSHSNKAADQGQHKLTAHVLSISLYVKSKTHQENKIPTKMKIHRDLAHFYLFQCLTCPHFLVLPPPSVIPRWHVVALLQAAAGNQTLLFFS